MATYYVATTGTGTGVGSEADPFTWDQAAAFSFSAGDELVVKSGTHTCSVVLSSSALATVRGDLAGARPVLDFGSTSGNLITLTRTGARFGYLETSGSTTGIHVFFSSGFNPLAWKSKVKDFYGFGGSRVGRYALCEADSIRVSNGAVDQCYSAEILKDQAFGISVSNSVFGKLSSVSTSESDIVSNSIIADGAGASTAGVVSNSIIVNCTTGIASTSQVFAYNCLFFGNTTKTSGTVYENGSVDMDDDPFEDSSSLDFRITTAAQSKSYISSLVRVMLCQLNTPGITMNTEAELLAMVASGGGSSIYNPFNMPSGNPFVSY